MHIHVYVHYCIIHRINIYCLIILLLSVSLPFCLFPPLSLFSFSLIIIPLIVNTCKIMISKRNQLVHIDMIDDNELNPGCMHYPQSKAALTRIPSTPDGSQLYIFWNQGPCMRLGSCQYRHKCGTCGEAQMACDCSLTPVNSVKMYFRR